MSLDANKEQSSVYDTNTGLRINPENDKNITEFSRKLLTDFYLKDNETIQQGFARASFAWSNGDRALAQRLYDYVSNGWFMFASPVLSNAPKALSLDPLVFEKVKGMPISCFLSYVPDSIDGLNNHTVESRWLSVLGGGVGGHWRDIRAVSDKAPGPIPFLHTVDADMEAYKQGKVRRGSYAAYMDVSHPDIIEFLNIRVPTGDASRKCHSAGFHNAINITDAFMYAVDNNLTWNLIDPSDGSVRETVEARKLWDQILDVRYRTGEPYLYFIDEANRKLPEAQRNLGLKSNGSNLCVEITLPTSEDRTAVCCLSSLNIEKYDEWKDTTIVQDLIKMLDNVIEYFINNAPTPLAKAAFSASRERSLGLGTMGFHYYLQKNMIPFESEKARELNKEIFEYIQKEALVATRELADIHGECPDFITTLSINGIEDKIEITSSDYVTINGIEKRAYHITEGDTIEMGPFKFTVETIDGLHSHSGRRNAHLIACAPNANSGILLGTSPSIEPSNSNAYIHQTRAGSWPVKNRYLEQLLESKGMNETSVWSDIITNKGSIQHMDVFTEEEKNVFKTAIEINQIWVVQHAADRQPYICQSQSLNLFFEPRCSRSHFSKVHRIAQKKGIKSLYYVRTITPNRAENVSEKIVRNALADGDEGSNVVSMNAPPASVVDQEPTTCVACEG